MLLQTAPFLSTATIVTITVSVIGGLILWLLDKAYTARKKRNEAKNAQPKLAVRLEFLTRGRMNEGISHLNNFTPDTVVDAGKLNEIIINFKLDWDFAMHITNQSDAPAYKIKLVVPETKGRFIVKKEIDYTKPFVHGETRAHEIKVVQYFVGTSVEADVILSQKPFTEIVLEYENSVGSRFATSFFPKETEESNKNIYRVVA
ncbi:hypothetical protein [Hymenobacter lapidiphilus]|uniref:hypothetical protein n=1 Tax=Hymenobacter sp. CCM 8763 TaxID=2303334 RepID=UPI0011C17A58|nr:hypothetical protein [Hymenobacter sp. CCM 8763]